MFALEFAALGSFLPIFSLYLRNELDFSGQQVGWMQSCGATSALMSPLLGTLVVHRWLAPNLVLTLAHVLSAIAILIFANLRSFEVLLPLYLLYQTCFSPTVGLCNGIAFEYLGSRRNHFGEYRLWGTVSWALVSWGGAAWLWTPWAKLEHIFYASAFFSLIMGILCCSLPAVQRETPSQGWRNFFPRSAFQQFFQWSIFRWGLLAFVMGCCFQFHFVGVSPQLGEQGFSEAAILVMMSTAQIAEVLLMWKLRPMIERYGLRRVLLMGCFAIVVEFAIMGAIAPLPWVLISLICHGVTFSFLGTPMLMSLDSQLSPKDRSGVHQLLGLMAPGLSSLIGGSFAGAAMERYFHQPFLFWLSPMALGLLATLMVLRFRMVVEHPLPQVQDHAQRLSDLPEG